jgi:hypothetical protein
MNGQRERERVEQQNSEREKKICSTLRKEKVRMKK